MKKEFDLSHELQLEGNPLISERNVNKIREFIKRLKEFLDTMKCHCEDCVKGEIDKLAGEKLK